MRGVRWKTEPPTSITIQSDANVTHLESKLREATKKLAAMKEELECVTTAVEQSDEKTKHVEMQLRESNKKCTAMKEELECVTTAVEQCDVKLKRIEIQVQEMRCGNHNPRPATGQSDAMVRQLEEKLRENDKKMEAMRLELQTSCKQCEAI